MTITIGMFNLIKKISTVFLMLSIVVFFVSCHSGEQYVEGQEADAYLAIFQALIPLDDPYINSQACLYVAVDLSDILYENPDLIKSKIEEYLRDINVTLLWDNRRNLIEKGYITYDASIPWASKFNHGFLFKYKDINLSETLLETEASQYFASMGASGAIYVVEKIKGTWKLEITQTWVS